MNSEKRIRDYGITIGSLKRGKLNAITDVNSVKVGHVTLDENNIKTGVTAIIPHSGNLFKEKVTASSYVLNGYGKSIGLMQISEIGSIETPIILTNTFSVGTAYNAVIEYMLKDNEDIGIATGTINPIICECNDGYLNDIRNQGIKTKHVISAIKNARKNFKEGSVGAGTGMSCLGLKGGIGTASRILELDNNTYTIGSLILSNFGKGTDLLIDGIKAGKIINNNLTEEDKGSIIIIIATDIPLSNRQLKRVCKRAVVGLVRTGSYIGNGSGDIIIGFTTANNISHYELRDFIPHKVINENKIDLLFRAVAESVEESILNSLISANKIIGRNHHIRPILKDYLNLILNKKS